MKLLILLFLLVTNIVNTSAQMNPENITKTIEAIRLEFAPDKRTAIFNIDYTIDDKSVSFSGETNLPEAKNKLLSMFEKSNIVDEMTLLPSKDLGNKIYGIVNLSVANVRTKPEHSAELATQVLLGARLKILKSRGEWYLVQCEDDYIGWLDDDGIFLMDLHEFDNWNKAPKVIVTAPFAFAFSEGSTASSTVSDVVQGNLLKFTTRNADFIKTEFPDGRIAYIFADQVEDYNKWLDTRIQSFETIKRTAETMMGIPYVWGGTSVKGYDCSGFTKIVFQLNGIQLPRDASQQVNVGELVDLLSGFENLKPGDLLFFGPKEDDSKKERITHVAIYLGNLEFIHASGRVRINSFDRTKSNFAEGRLRTFVKAKRIFSSLGRNDVKLIKNLIVN